MPRSKLEDLTLVLAVTVAAVAFNAAEAIFIGLLLGLLMFAARNARQPVRHLWTGEQLQSNCAYGARELALLAQHGQSIRVIELESEMFFGAVSSLDQSLTASLASAHTVIFDWSHQTTVMNEQIPLFKGLTANQLKQMQASMRERLYQAGEVIFSAGDASDSMLVVLQGRASVMVRLGASAQGREVRLTSMRRGGVVGEMGFLDRAPRLATVIAQESLLAYVLTRDAFDTLRETWPETAYILIENLTLNLAVRLRHTNRLAMARNAVA